MPEDLLARLQNLENSYYGDKEAARQKNFFDTYGARFNNNRGLGLAILNELDARGVDTSAADEAVQQILDTLRTECNEIIESIKVVQEDAIQNARKVEEVANVVSDVVANNPDASVSPDLGGDVGMDAAMPPAMEGGELNPDALMGGEGEGEGEGELPPPPEGEEMPPAEGEGELPPPPEGGEMPPAEEPPAPPAEEQVPPEPMVSDARMKNIRNIVSDVRMKRIKAKAKTNSNSYKPSLGVLEAASRGY